METSSATSRASSYIQDGCKVTDQSKLQHFSHAIHLSHAQCDKLTISPNVLKTQYIYVVTRTMQEYIILLIVVVISCLVSVVTRSLFHLVVGKPRTARTMVQRTLSFL